MKNIIRLIAATTVLFTLVLMPLNSPGQTYQQSTQLPFSFYAFADMGKLMGSITIPNPTLSETITIDPNAQTIRVNGSLSVAAANGSVSLDETPQIGIFPNPPQSVAGELTVTLSEAANNLTFDTGVQQMSWNGQFYTFNGEVHVNEPVTTSYSLVTGGNTYTGSAAGNAAYSLSFGPDVDTSGYPASISLIPGLDINSGVGFVSPLPNFTAPNGFQIQVTAVPEPSTFALGGLAVCALLLRHRRCGAIDRRA